MGLGLDPSRLGKGPQQAGKAAAPKPPSNDVGKGFTPPNAAGNAFGINLNAASKPQAPPGVGNRLSLQG